MSMSTDPSAGEMARLIDQFDWPATPLGPPESWSEALKISVSLCTSSRFPLILWWGKELTMLYNDPYREHLQSKHPWALGKPGREVWAEIWPVIGPMLEGVLETGEATWSDDLLLYLERNGYPEESYHTFSYSALKNTQGKIVGIFTPVNETTQRVVSERRLATLREIGSTRGPSESELCPLLAGVLAKNNPDLPCFALFSARPGHERLTCLLSSHGVSLPDAVLDACLRESAPDGHLQVLDHPEAFVAELPKSPLGFRPSTAVLVTLPDQHDGEHFVFFAGVSPHRPLDDGYRTFFRTVTRELTLAIKEIRAYEQERRRTQMLLELDRAKTEFFSNVSHEFRTPLTLMLGPIDDCLQNPGYSSEELRARLEIAMRNGQRLQKLVNTLLEFARIEAGRTEGSFSETDLSALTSDLCSSFRSLMEKAGLHLNVRCDPSLPPVFVDRDMWEKIVLNLVSNAFKFTERGGVEVSLQQADGCAELRVRDTGTGISPDDLKQIFKRFHRLNNSFSRSHEGSGIGLALVKELVHIHHGNISVSSDSTGTEFVITLPLGSAHLPAAQVERAEQGSSTVVKQAFVDEAQLWRTDASGKNQKLAFADAYILLVDDNADMRAYVEKILGDHWTVKTATDGLDALDSIRQRIPDLVITDVMMPKLDGFGLLQALRRDPRWAELPVILLSARAGEEATVEGLSAGATDYLVKPFSARELVARVGAALEASKAQRLALIHKELQDLARLASHELQGPVRIIKSYLRLLTARYQNRLGADADEFIQKCGGAAETIDRMVNELWTYARIIRPENEHRLFDANLALKQALNELAGKIEERGAVVEHASLPQVHGVEKQIALVLRHLIDNALSFTEASPRIAIAAHGNGSEWLFSVADNGRGIEPIDSSKIFAPFTRLWEPLSASGVGMGLTICKRAVETHGGKIWVQSNPSGGSTFYFTLPARH